MNYSYRGLFFLTVWALLLVNPLIGAPAPAHAVDGSFIKEWLVLGPIPSRDMEIDFLAAAGGETNVRPKEGDSVQTRNGTSLEWKRVRSEHNLVSLDRIFGMQEWAVAYAYCELEVPEATETDLRLYASQTAALWLNGQAAGFAANSRSGATDIFPTLPLRLNAGRNAVLLKLRQVREEWEFMAQALPPTRGLVEFEIIDPSRRAAAERSFNSFKTVNWPVACEPMNSARPALVFTRYPMLTNCGLLPEISARG